MFESHAGVLNRSLFTKYALPCLTKIATTVRQQLSADPQFTEPMPPLTVFAKDGHYALPDLVDSGYDVVGLDWTVCPKWARQVAKDKVTLQVCC